MNKALQILSLTLFIFLVSCEAEFPISLEPTSDEIVMQGAKSAFNVSQSQAEIIKGEYIVMFKKDIPYFERLDEQTIDKMAVESRSSRSELAEVKEERETSIESYLVSTLNDHHIPPQTVMEVYDIGSSKGALLSISDEEAAILAQDERVETIEPNELIAMNLTPGAKGRLIPADDGPADQLTTYNINGIGGAKDHRNANTWAFIIDSGIDMDHPDLNVQQYFSRSFVPYENNPNDEFGHGTHVAGIIGAEDNGTGVVGVASGATLVSLKVLDRNGYGTKDYLMKALSYVGYLCIPGDVVNISLGTDPSNMINDMILNLKNRYNIHFVIAAGNLAVDAGQYSPANINDPEVYVVGAVNGQDQLTDFSNFGSTVTCLAPGEGIYSTYKDGQYAWMNGTSMAAPHIAGILLANDGKFKVKTTVVLPSGNMAKVFKQY